MLSCSFSHTEKKIPFIMQRDSKTVMQQCHRKCRKETVSQQIQVINATMLIFQFTPIIFAVMFSKCLQFKQRSPRNQPKKLTKFKCVKNSQNSNYLNNQRETNFKLCNNIFTRRQCSIFTG